jgi:hypothetical protein
MKQRGRKSTAQLTVIAGTIDGRPKAPTSLSSDEAEVWNGIVSSEPADFFRTAAVRDLLAAYCEHRCRAVWIKEEIETALKPGSEDTLADVDRLMKMAERETRTCVTLATKMRLTNQSRYQPSVASAAARNASGPRKLWQRGG